MRIIKDDFFNHGGMNSSLVRSIYCHPVEGNRWQVRVDYNDGYWHDEFTTESQAIAVRDRLISKWEGESNMFSEIKETATKFLQENRMLLAWIAVLFLADHFFFNGQFRQRLQGMVEKLIGGVEKKIEEFK